MIPFVYFASFHHNMFVAQFLLLESWRTKIARIILANPDRFQILQVRPQAQVDEIQDNKSKDSDTNNTKNENEDNKDDSKDNSNTNININSNSNDNNNNETNNNNSSSLLLSQSDFQSHFTNTPFNDELVELIWNDLEKDEKTNKVTFTAIHRWVNRVKKRRKRKKNTVYVMYIHI